MAYANTARKSAWGRVFLALAALLPWSTPASAAVAPAYGSLPLRFEPNVGQMDARFAFRSRAAGHELFLAPDEAVIAVRGAAAPLRMKLAGGRAPRRIAGEALLPGHTNYYLGNDRTRWRTHVPAYGRVRYEQVYPGIDLVYYGSERQLEYDFVVAPGADPGVIAFDVSGADSLRLSAEGALVLASGPGEIRQRRPVLYQEVDGRRQTVDGAYVLRGATRVGLEVGPYDRTRPLVIDPVITLAYSTYFGGSSSENSIYSGIAVDALGAAYIVGNTYSIDLPGAVPGSKPGGTSGDVFVAKISPAGDAIEYATYLGGAVDEEGHDIAIDPAGNAYIVGFVHHPATGFPVLNAFQPTLQGGLGDAIVAKFDPDGTLLYSSFLGGRGAGIDRSYERAHGVAADAEGHMYVTGTTSSTVNFPIVGGVQSTNRGGFDMFVTKVSPDGLSLVYSTLLGGTLSDMGYHIALDGDHNAYVVGVALSFDNPSTPADEGMPVVNAFQPAHGGGTNDAFVFKLNAAGNQLVFSTYLGGSASESGDGTLVAPTGGLAVDAQGHVYVAGHTTSANFPTTPNRIHAYTGSQDLFVTKLAPAGNQLVYSTFLGGATSVDACAGLAVDSRGSAYVAGWSPTGFPKVNALPPDPGQINSNNGVRNDATVAKLTPDGGAIVYSTYLGGLMREVLQDIAVDANGHAYITGVTYSASFPLAGAVDPICVGCADGFFEGIGDAFVAKIFLTNAAPVAMADAYATDEEVPLTVPAPGVLGNDTDVNPQDVPAAILVSPPLHGSLTLAGDGSFTYLPEADFSGTDSFTYKATDGLLESTPATVTLTVAATNDPPVADAGGPYAVDEGATLSLAGSGTDGEGDPLTFDWDLDGDGVFESPGQTVSFAAGDGPATATVFLRVTDATGASGMDSALVTIRNLPPTAGADAFATDEDTPLTVPVPGVLANDTDFDGLTALLVAGPANGALALEADGSFVYTPAGDFNGSDSFSYRAHDGVDGSEVATVALTVSPVNDAPSAEAGGPYAVDEGATVTLAGSGSDVDGGSLAFEWDLDNDGEFDDASGASTSYTAGNGPASVLVALRVTDANGASAVDTATIDVHNVAPVAAPDAYTTAEDMPLDVAAPGVLANDQDVDPLSAVLVSGPANGTLTLEADGSFRYVPAPDFNGSDSFSYRAHDGLDGSAIATVALTLTPVNDAPTASAGGPYIVNEGQSVVLAGSGSDLDGDSLSFAWDLDGDGTFETDGQTPSLSVGDGPATLTVTLRVSDGQGGSAASPAVVTVLNVAPVAVADALNATAGVPLAVAAPGVLGNDQDFDALSAVLVSGPAKGTLTLGADGSVQYLALVGESGTDTFTYRAADGVAQSDPATVTITIAPATGGPDAVDDTFLIKKRRYLPHVLQVLRNDRPGFGGGPVAIVAVTQPAHGRVWIAPGGHAVVYRAARRFRGVETFTYTIRNASGQTDTATVTVKVGRRGHRDDDDDDDDDGGCDGHDHDGD